MAMVHATIEPGARARAAVAGGVQRPRLRAGRRRVRRPGRRRRSAPASSPCSARGRLRLRRPRRARRRGSPRAGGAGARRPADPRADRLGGPFVMNTSAELVQAFEDHNAGRLGQPVPHGDVGRHGLTDEEPAVAVSAATAGSSMLLEPPGGRGVHGLTKDGSPRAQTSSALVVDGSQVELPALAPPAVADRAPGRRFVVPDQAVEVEQAVQVVGLVLQAAGEQAGARQLDRRRRPGPAGDAAQSGAAGRGTARRAPTGSPRRRRRGSAMASGPSLEHRVEHARRGDARRRRRGSRRRTPQRRADLVGGQAHAVGGVHGVEHVLRPVADLRRHLARPAWSAGAARGAPRS